VPRGDGRLTHDLIPGEKGPQDACGVFGVWAPGEDVAKLTYYGLYALQHRGQESAGIATSDGQRLLVYKDMGLVSQVFDERSLASLRGHLAVGHCRYSTTGGSTWENAQPTLGGHDTVARWRWPTTATSSTRPSCATSSRAASSTGPPASSGAATPPTPRWSRHCWPTTPTAPSRPAALDVLPRLRGAFCFVFMDEHTLYAARDPHGIRPLVLGGSTAAGSWPRRRPPSTSSAPP
jgi:amidophosphoribosyltransferase